MKSKLYVATVSALLILTAVALSKSLTSHNCTLSGNQQSVSPSQLNLTLDSAGEITGTFTLNIQYDSSGVINAGQWELNAGQNNESGAATPIGMLAGQVTAGTVTLNERGSMASLTSVQLSITTSGGNFQVSSGSGHLTLTGDQTTSTLTGALALDY